MSPNPSPAVRAIPLLLFAIFVVFWSTLDIVYGVPLVILPSVLVALALLVRALSGVKG
jgi:hypothetical protein